jgi:hypothetical protein
MFKEILALFDKNTKKNRCWFETFEI